jgi:hypothetical protein
MCGSIRWGQGLVDPLEHCYQEPLDSLPDARIFRLSIPGVVQSLDLRVLT